MHLLSDYVISEQAINLYVLQNDEKGWLYLSRGTYGM